MSDYLIRYYQGELVYIVVYRCKLCEVTGVGEIFAWRVPGQGGGRSWARVESQTPQLQGGGKLTPLLTTKTRFGCKNRTRHEVVQQLTCGTLCATLYGVTSIILFSGYSAVLSGAETC
jgi:hypothetical protein